MLHQCPILSQRFLGGLPEAHNVQISCTYRLHPMPEVHLRHAAEATEQVARISAKQLLFTPYCVEGVHTWTTTAGSTVGDLFEELAELYADDDAW